jgi:diguanylate cyclase
LNRLHELTTHVAVEVDQHSGRIEAINQELTSTDKHEAMTIIKVVAKLVEANQRMQARLATTEDRLREQAQELEVHAIESRTDPLTTLANRRALDDEMSRRLAEFRRHRRTFSLIMLDIDRFKQFNDAHGHQAGDEILRGVGEILRRQTREMDVVVRYGGEEFAVILPGTPMDEARRAVTRVRESLEKARFHLDDKELGVTGSAGVAEIVADEDASGLIRRADEALYAAKAAGRNCAYWHDGDNVHPVDGRIAQESAEDKPQEVPQLQTPGREPELAATDGPIAADVKSPDTPAPSEPGFDQDGEAPSDTVVDLPSRTAFCHQLRTRLAEWKRGGPTCSVMLMEVDQRDQIVSREGPQALQAALRAVAKFALAMVREMDNMAHYDCCCLAVLLPGADLANAIKVAERLRQGISEYHLPLGKDSLRLTVSLGVVGLREHDDSMSVLKSAEAALAAAGHRGGNCTYHHDGQRCAPISALLEVMDYLT